MDTIEQFSEMLKFMLFKWSKTLYSHFVFIQHPIIISHKGQSEKDAETGKDMFNEKNISYKITIYSPLLPSKTPVLYLADHNQLWPLITQGAMSTLHMVATPSQIHLLVFIPPR